MGNVKGTGWKAIQEFFLNIEGQAGIDKVIAALNPKDQVVFMKPILPISWINRTSYLNFLLTADKVLGAGDLNLAKEAVRYEVRKNFTGIYKLFLIIATPKFLLSQAASAWKQYHDSGRASAEMIGKNKAIVKIVDYPDIPLKHEIEEGTSFEELARLCGVNNARCTHPKCIARGDAQCIFEITWD